MEELKDTQTYGALINAMRKKGVKFTNNNLFSEDIRSFVERKRIKYHVSERCLIFFLDEEKYYRLLFHLDPDHSWDLPKLDKPVLIRTRFTKGKKKAELLKLEGQMREKGFVLKDTNVFVTLDFAPFKEFYRQRYERSKKILKASHLRIIGADYSYRSQIDKLMDGQDMINYWHRPYQTEDEIKSAFDRGCYTAIVNEKDEIVAYTSGGVGEGKLQPDIAMVIKDEYKRSGLAVILFYYCLAYEPSDLMRKTSIDLANSASVKLHKKLGWKFTDKYMENWLLE